MKKYRFNFAILLAILFSHSPLPAQIQRAHLSKEGTIQLSEIAASVTSQRNNTFNQLPGFPKQVVAHPSFKNLRNVTLADINNDGVEEILWAANQHLYAYAAGELLWEKELSDLALYPPSVADMDGDGNLEIAQATGGGNDIPFLYLMDRNGNDLPGWPVSLNSNRIISAPTLSDLDEDGIREVIACELDPPAGQVHVLHFDGSSFGANWPVMLDGPPAVTPSVADVNNDGAKEIIIPSSKSQVILDTEGEFLPGFPVTTAPEQRYSYQSPLIYDFDGMAMPNIVGASHGDDPQFYCIDAQGMPRDGWPVDVPENTWTYSPPTLVEIEEEPWIFMSRRLSGSEAAPMLFAWDDSGNLKPGFPISQLDGLEGIISVADVDGDDEYELVFGSDLFLSNGNTGFIHAYELDGTGEVEGFPIQPPGMTYLNGAALGDVDNDGMLDLTALSYTVNFGTAVDSLYLNCYDLEVPYQPESVLWSTYKGDNSREGWLNPPTITATAPFNLVALPLKLSPNPAKAWLNYELSGNIGTAWKLNLFDLNGKLIESYGPFDGIHSAGRIKLPRLASGAYLLQASDWAGNNLGTAKFSIN